MPRTVTPTPANKILLYRRRQGWTQAEAAAHWQIPLYLYKSVEGGEAEPSFSVPKVAKLQPHERCLIARVQAKMTRIDLAKALGCSKAWVTEMEHDRAPVTMLLKYWNLAAD